MFGAQDATVLRVGWDATAVESGVTNLNSRLKAAKSEMSATSAQMGGFGRSTDGLKSKQEGLNKIYELQGHKVKDLKANYDRLVEAKGADSEAAINASKKYNYALADYAKMETQLKDLTTEIVHQESAWGQMETGLQGFSDKTGKLADGFGTAGRKMTMGITLPIVGAGAAIIKTGIDFDKSMSKVQALSGATAEEMAKMEGQAKQLGETTVFSASQAADAQAFLAMAGWDVADIYDAMPGLLSLAAAGQMELGRTADITSNIMQAFAINAGEAGRVSDVLAAAASNSNTDVEMLGEAMEYAAPTANVFGWSLEETTAAMMKFGDAGIQGGKAGQAWSTSLQRLSKPTKAMREMMEELNIQFFDANGVMQPLPDLVGEIEKATKGMNDEQQANVITTLFGNQAFKHWAILMEQGSDSLREQTTELQNSEGAAKQMADTMLDNGYGSAIEFKSALEGLAITLSEHLMPNFITATEKATDLVRWFGALDRDTQKYILTAAGIAAVLGPAAIVLSTTLKAVSYLTGGLARATGAYGRYTASAKVAQAGTKSFGDTAMIAGTKVNNANRGVGRFGGTLGKIGGIASIAGLGMLAFGGDSEQGIGTALLFAPEILKLGKGILGVGKNALTGGARFLGMGKNAVTAGQGITGLVRGVGAFGKAAGLVGGPVGWAITAITTLGVAGFELYQHMKEELIPSLDDFGDGVSEATTEAVLSYKKLNDEATAELNQFAWSGAEVTDEIAESLTGKFSAMGETITSSLKSEFDESVGNLDSFLKDSKVITQREQDEIYNNLESNLNKRTQVTEDAYNEINRILESASEQNRKVTAEEQEEINYLQDVMMKQAVRTMSEGEQEQLIIMGRLKEESGNITKLQAAETIQNSYEARQGAVEEATKKYEEVKAQIEFERDVTGTISAEQADALIAEHRRMKDEAIFNAENMHLKVVEQAQLLNEGLNEQVHLTTGKVLTQWDKFVSNMIGPINWIYDKINNTLNFFGLKDRLPIIPEYNPSRSSAKVSAPVQSIPAGGQNRALSYQFGTNPNGHPDDSWAVTSEAGQELVHDPKVGTYLTGNSGPEMTYLHKGSSVLPAHHTKSLLSSYGFPAYETGVGGNMDWFDMLLSGPSGIIKGMAKSLGNWNNFSGVFKNLGDGIVNKLVDAASNYVTGLFGFGGDGAEGGISFAKGGGFPGMRRSSGYGPRWGSFHYGVDFAGPVGTPIPSQSNGRVSRSATGFNGGYGNLVVVSSGPMDHYYAHNSRNLVRTGQPVAKGQIVALVGNTGRSTGPHVHYEQRLNGKRIKPQGYDRGGMSSMKELAYVSERGQDEYHLSMHPSDYDRSMGMFMEIGERLGVFNPMPSVESIQEADTRSYGRAGAYFDSGAGMAREIVELLKNVSRPIIQPGALNVDGHELTEILFEYIDEKFEQTARLNNLSL